MLPLVFATLLGCPLFPPNDAYTAPVTDAPVDPNSARYIAGTIEAGDTSGFWVASDPVETINVASGSTAKRRVVQKVPYHRFGARVPWSDSFRIEPLSDAHAIVLEPATCEVFELYDASFAHGVLSAYSGAHWSLRKPFVPLSGGTPSAMASGLSLLAGLIRWEEVASGHIDHALDWGAPAGTVAQWAYVRPASDTDQLPYRGSSAYRLPYGAHLRLRRSFDLSRFGPQSRAIARAMQRYGIYLADTGSSGNALYNARALNGAAHWNARDLASLGTIHLSDFDVLALPAIARVPGHD